MRVTPPGQAGPMALATFSDALPTVPVTSVVGPVVTPVTPVVGPGLSARMSSLDAALTALVADLDPGLLVGADAASLYAGFCRLERLVGGAKALLAPRIAESGHWAEEGFRSPAGLLASLEGGSAGAARRTIEAGRLLGALPGTEEALRKGQLSGPKLVEITRAASLDPASEGGLLAGSASEPLHVVKERCRKVRTQAAGADPVATEARIHAERSFASWTDHDGAFCYSGRDTAERGAKLLARLVPVANRLRHDRRAAAAEGGGTPRAGGRSGPSRSTTPSPPLSPPPSPPPESEGALRADALFVLLGAGRPGRSSPTASGSPSAPTAAPSSPGSGPARSGTTTTTSDGTTSDGTTSDGTTPDGTTPATTADDPGLLADPADLGSADDLVTSPPPATVIVRVDLDALRRGHALPGELCEIEGQGTVPVPVVQSLIDDAFLAWVFTQAGDIRAVAHRGRTINALLRTALVFRDKHCVVPGCGVGYSLEIDHVHPLEHGGRTELDNLALLCRHHHRLKTYEGWTLLRTGPTDEDPRWTFTPQPAFGQEPDLGLDRPDNRDRPEPVPRT